MDHSRLNQTITAITTKNSNSKAKCSMLFKSFVLNFDDLNYFNNQQTNSAKFDYPIRPSFTKTSVESTDLGFDKIKGVQFRQVSSRMFLTPSGDIAAPDACFWRAEDCAQGFVQHMIMSVDKLDEKRVSQKVILFTQGAVDSVKFVCYLHKNRLHFSLFEEAEESTTALEWLTSSFLLDKSRDLNRNLKLTFTWMRDKYVSLHVDGFLVDIVTKPSSPPVNSDIYASLSSSLARKHQYEYGLRLVGGPNTEKMVSKT